MKDRRGLGDHRDEIIGLFISQRKPLNYVMNHMLTHRGVQASRITYKRKLKEWGVGKNTKRGGTIPVNPTPPGPGIRQPTESSSSCLNASMSAPLPQSLAAVWSSTLTIRQEHLTRRLGSRLHLSPERDTVTPLAWESSWSNFMELLEPQAVGSPSLLQTNTSHATFSLFPDIIRTHSFKLPDLLPQAADFISNMMPEKRDGQNLEMVRQITQPGSQSTLPYILLQLFGLANKFRFWDVLQNKSYQSIREAIWEHDCHILKLLQMIGFESNQGVMKIFSLKGHSTIDAIKEQLFATALRLPHLPLIKLLLEAGVDVDAVVDNSYGGKSRPLGCAVSIEDEQISIEVIRLLLDNKARPNPIYLPWEDITARTSTDCSTIRLAAALGHLEAVKVLISAGCKACGGAICLAIKRGEKELLRILLDAIPNASLDSVIDDSDVIDRYSQIFDKHSSLYHDDYRFNMSGSYPTAIGRAAFEGDVEIVEILIERGFDIHAVQKTCCGGVLVARHSFPDNQSEDEYWHARTPTTVLGFAILGGHLRMVQFLLERGVRLDDTSCISPLLTACYCGRSDIAMALIQAGANVLAADVSGMALNLYPSALSRPIRAVKTTYIPRSTLLGALLLSWRQTGQMDLQLCEYLILRGARVDHALFEATRVGNMPFISMLLKSNRKICLSEEFGGAALACAINSTFLDAAEALFRNGAALSEPGEIVCIGSLEMFEFLEEANILEDILLINGPRILSSAILNAKTALSRQIFSRFIELGLKTDLQFKPAQWSHVNIYQKVIDDDTREPLFIELETPLDVALLVDDMDLLKDLVDHCVPWTATTLVLALKSDRSREYLHILISSPPPTMERTAGRPDMRRIYPEGTISCDRGTNLPLVMTVMNGDIETFQILRERLYWGDKLLGTVITALVDTGGKWELVKSLIDEGGSLNESYRNDAPYGKACSPLHAAIYRRRLEVVSSLITAGADPNRPHVCKTPLYLACHMGYIEMIDFLIDSGADVNAADSKYGTTVLQHASAQGFLKVARRLLQAGASINADQAEFGGFAALQGAAQYGRLEMLHLLLSWNPKVNGRYRGHYIRAVKLAERNGHLSAARLLKSYGTWKPRWDKWYDSVKESMYRRDGHDGFLVQRADFQVSEDEHELDEREGANNSSFLQATMDAYTPSHTSAPHNADLIMEAVEESGSLTTTHQSQVYSSPSDLLVDIDLDGHIPPADDASHGIPVIDSAEQTLPDPETFRVSQEDLDFSAIDFADVGEFVEQWRSY